jgi:hemoglobin-like flavoprotein
MTPQQITLVRNSHAALAPVAPQVAGIFFAKVFGAQPELRRLSKGDIGPQGERLTTMIGAAVYLLDRPGTLMPSLRTLGARHARLGVRAEHHAGIAAAWMATLESELGSDFDAEVRAAWGAMAALVSHTMLEGAEQAAALAA